MRRGMANPLEFHAKRSCERAWEMPGKLDEWQLKQRGAVPKLPKSVRADPERNKRRWRLEVQQQQQGDKIETATCSNRGKVKQAPAAGELVVARASLRIHPADVPFHAEQVGPYVMVRDPQEAIRLYRGANVGQFVGQRMNFHNTGCFDFHNDDNGKEDGDKEDEGQNGKSSIAEQNESADGAHTIANGTSVGSKKRRRWESGKAWTAHCSRNAQLYLNPLETLYLLRDLPILELRTGKAGGVAGLVTAEEFYRQQVRLCSGFLRKYAVYRHLQQLGWTVTEGMQFAVDFLIYKDAVDMYHSSAGVRIVDPSDSVSSNLCSPNVFFEALQRELKGCRKVLLLAEVDVPNGLDVTNAKSIDREIRVQLHAADSWFANRSRTVDLGQPTDNRDEGEDTDQEED